MEERLSPIVGQVKDPSGQTSWAVEVIPDENRDNFFMNYLDKMRIRFSLLSESDRETKTYLNLTYDEFSVLKALSERFLLPSGNRDITREYVRFTVTLEDGQGYSPYSTMRIDHRGNFWCIQANMGKARKDAYKNPIDLVWQNPSCLQCFVSDDLFYGNLCRVERSVDILAGTLYRVPFETNCSRFIQERNAAIQNRAASVPAPAAPAVSAPVSQPFFVDIVVTNGFQPTTFRQQQVFAGTATFPDGIDYPIYMLSVPESARISLELKTKITVQTQNMDGIMFILP